MCARRKESRFGCDLLSKTSPKSEGEGRRVEPLEPFFPSLSLPPTEHHTKNSRERKRRRKRGSCIESLSLSFSSKVVKKGKRARKTEKLPKNTRHLPTNLPLPLSSPSSPTLLTLPLPLPSLNDSDSNSNSKSKHSLPPLLTLCSTSSLSLPANKVDPVGSKNSPFSTEAERALKKAGFPRLPSSEVRGTGTGTGTGKVLGRRTGRESSLSWEEDEEEEDEEGGRDRVEVG